MLISVSDDRLGAIISFMKNGIMSREEVIQGLIESATPIDFEALIKEGIIEKDGAWYRILNLKKLPKHASTKIKTLETGPKGTRVKFRPASKRAANLVKKIRP